MKFITYTLLFVCLLNAIYSVKINKSNDKPPHHYVVDHTSNPSLHHVIRRNPTITVKTSQSPIPAFAADNSVMSFGNTSDNNGPNPGANPYSKTAEIAGPAIYAHSRGTMSVITEQPAHVGWRSEQKTITSLNKATNKVEQHVINKHVPILGNIEKVHILYLLI